MITGLPEGVQRTAEPSPLRSFYLPPTRILWQSDTGVTDAEALLVQRRGQSVLGSERACVLTSAENQSAGILLDFGVEIQGSIEIFTPQTASQAPRAIRVRFGESASEAMSELGEKGSQTDHAMRDQNVRLPWLGRTSVGPSGFRFVRIDSLEPTLPVELIEVRAVLVLRDVPALGSFRCDDERLNQIWKTGAYTVHLNMQEYVWDGIKRDRLVWIGDMHPEVSTINAVFGFNDVVPKSLDSARDTYAAASWMNGFSSYSIWWLLMQRDWWMHHGNLDYLRAQQPYLKDLLAALISHIDENGVEHLDGARFLDWPTARNEAAIHEGLQALMLLGMEAGEQLCSVLADEAGATACRAAAKKLRQHHPGAGVSKQSTALMTLAGLIDPGTARQILEKDGPRGLSTFYGFYVLEALGRLGVIDTALDFISRYWGGMLDFGATTFWEDFDLDWTVNAGRIDELPKPGQKDLHGDFGDHCYIGFRHSFCHGWASGPTAWLSKSVLGITPLEPGFAKVRVVPQLGKLKWAEGTYPTPKGVITVCHERLPDGTIESKIQAPDGIEIIKV